MERELDIELQFHLDMLAADYVRRGIEHGMTKELCVATLTALTDRYPMDVEQDGMAPRVMQMNVANLYDYLIGAGIHQRRAHT